MSVTAPDDRRRPWRDGDDPGRRRFADVGADRPRDRRAPSAVRVAYETWGTLNPARDNAVLVEHALTGDSHVEGPQARATRRPGGGTGLIGPGRPLDTDRLFVVASNVLGGCQGSTGPSSSTVWPAVGKPLPLRDDP